MSGTRRRILLGIASISLMAFASFVLGRDLRLVGWAGLFAMRWRQ